MDVIVGLLWFVFVASALLLGLIILIQEGKGGGLGEAFGGMGAETFGVKATGVNKFTTYLAIAFVLSAILINRCVFQASGPFSDEAPPAEAPADGGGEDSGNPGEGG